MLQGRTQCRELPLCVGSREGCQWQALPSPVQCEETVNPGQLMLHQEQEKLENIIVTVGME
jgi:hypothetical protein